MTNSTRLARAFPGVSAESLVRVTLSGQRKQGGMVHAANGGAGRGSQKEQWMNMQPAFTMSVPGGKLCSRGGTVATVESGAGGEGQGGCGATISLRPRLEGTQGGQAGSGESGWRHLKGCSCRLSEKKMTFRDREQKARSNQLKQLGFLAHVRESAAGPSSGSPPPCGVLLALPETKQDPAGPS